mmetsp:Transcript_101914/g.233379  ORF Transcript_101914/g.233379 Transcript_101914/m.233379 type:complete len:290 (+) Transcript_101914:206-1075(+)
MRVAVIPLIVEKHGRATLVPLLHPHTLAILPASLVPRPLVREGLRHHLTAGSEGVAHGADTFHEGAGAVDSPLLAGAENVPVLLVAALLVGMEIDLDSGNSAIVLFLRVRHQGPDSYPDGTVGVAPLQQGNNRGGRLVSLLVGEDEFSPGLPHAAFRGGQGGGDELLKDPLIRWDPRGTDAFQGGLGLPVDEAEVLALDRLPSVARAVRCRTQVHLISAILIRDLLPLHHLLQLRVRQKCPLRRANLLQQPLRLLDLLHVYLPVACLRDLRQQGGVLLFFHRVFQILGL